MKDINILWFKKDLRIDDNEALYESLKNHDILPIYIFEIELWNQKTHSRRPVSYTHLTLPTILRV